MKVIILAGGSGTRLWPLSRDRYPNLLDYRVIGPPCFKRPLIEVYY